MRRKTWHFPMLALMAGPLAPAEEEELLPEGFDTNCVIARANEEVITLLDVQLHWEIDLALEKKPRVRVGAAEIQDLVREIVQLRLWLQHIEHLKAGLHEELQRRIDESLSDAEVEKRLKNPPFSYVWENADVSQPVKEAVKDRSREVSAKQIALALDPTYQRLFRVRPEDLRRLYSVSRDTLFHSPEEVQLCSVILSRQVLGERALPTAQVLRQLAVEKGSLREAAREMAPDSYLDQPWKRIDKLGLKQDIMEFVKTAQPGQFSEPFEGPSTFSIYGVVARRAERTTPFDEATEAMRDNLRDSRHSVHSTIYFVRRILPESDLEPPDLFRELVAAVEKLETE